MNVTVATNKIGTVKADVNVIFVFSDKKILQGQSKLISEAYAETANYFASQGEKAGKKFTQTIVYTSSKSCKRVLIAGLGEKDSLTLETIRRSAAKAVKSAIAERVESIAFHLPTKEGVTNGDIAFAITEGAMLNSYKFDKYITTRDKEDTIERIKTVTIYSDSAEISKEVTPEVEQAVVVCEGVLVARNLANAPDNEIYPESLASTTVELGKSSGFTVKVLDKKAIEKEKMGGLLGVNKGSVKPPVFIIMEYKGKGAKKGEQPIVLVGKGITFDTGGISLKPGEGMAAMKMDMHGAASVIGTMVAISKANLPIHVIGLVPSTENMPSGTAIVPGDILIHRGGKTSEIDNTDAEGRLILADALDYATDLKPRAIIDLATLTGACVIALGTVTTGMMGTSDEVKSKLSEAGKFTNEYVWELPLFEEYEEQIKSDVADLKNTGGRAAGTITAGLFLKHFTKDSPWVHLDIAGTGMTSKESDYVPKGGTGVGVRLLYRALRNW